MQGLEEKTMEITTDPKIRKIVQNAFIDDKISMGDMDKFNNSKHKQALNKTENKSR